MARTNKDSKVRILLALPEALREQLKQSAEEYHRTLTNYIIYILSKHEEEKLDNNNK